MIALPILGSCIRLFRVPATGEPVIGSDPKPEVRPRLPNTGEAPTANAAVSTAGGISPDIANRWNAPVAIAVGVMFFSR